MLQNGAAVVQGRIYMFFFNFITHFLLFNLVKDKAEILLQVEELVTMREELTLQVRKHFASLQLNFSLQYGCIR